MLLCQRGLSMRSISSTTQNAYKQIHSWHSYINSYFGGKHFLSLSNMAAHKCALFNLRTTNNRGRPFAKNLAHMCCTKEDRVRQLFITDRIFPVCSQDMRTQIRSAQTSKRKLRSMRNKLCARALRTYKQYALSAQVRMWAQTQCRKTF